MFSPTGPKCSAGSASARRRHLRVTIEDGTERVVIDGGEVVKATQPESWDGTGIAGQVVKAVDERRFTLVVGYPALRPDQGVAADGFRDFAGAQAVENAAWSYIRKGGKIGLWHADGTEGSGECVESYIHRAGPWVIKAADGSEQTVNDGDWLLGIVWSPETWQLIKSGQVRGVSMQGSAVRRRPSQEALASLRG